MGCSTSKDVIHRMQEQEKKIDNLIQINRDLEQKLNDMQHNNNNQQDGRATHDRSDVANLKTTIDLRFGKLEKTVEKIHNEFKLKLFDGIVDGQENGVRPQIDGQNESLELDFGKERPYGLNSNYNIKKTVQNEIKLPDINGYTYATSHNQIQLNTNGNVRNYTNQNGIVHPFFHNLNKDISPKADLMGMMNVNKGVMYDEEINRIHMQVKNTMFKAK